MAIGEYRHRVRFQKPTRTPDGDGGYTDAWTDLDPAEWKVSLTPASSADLERVAAGTSITAASHVVAGYFHPGVTADTRMIYRPRGASADQIFAITGVVNVDLRSVDMICGAVQVIP